MEKLNVSLVITAPDGNAIVLNYSEGVTVQQLADADAIQLPEWLPNELIGFRERFKGYPEITG